MEWSAIVEELKEVLLASLVATLILIGLSVLMDIGFRALARSRSTQEPGLHDRDLENPHGSAGLADHAPTSLNESYCPPETLYQGRAAISKIFICERAGMALEAVTQVEAIAGRGLVGDRYFFDRGKWSGTDECEITMIAQEDLDAIERTTGIAVQSGEHRRNLVCRNVDLAALTGKRFRIGEAYFGFDRPRPPCSYLQTITEPGMVRALVNRSGIGVRCFKSGLIRAGDPIIPIELSARQALQRLCMDWWSGLRNS